MGVLFRCAQKREFLQNSLQNENKRSNMNTETNNFLIDILCCLRLGGAL